MVVVKNLPANAEDIRDVGLIPGLGRSPGEGNGYPIKYSCLETSMDRGAWRATVHGVTESDTTEQLTHNVSSVQFSSVAQSYLTPCNPMDSSTPGFPVHHQLPELAQT